MRARAAEALPPEGRAQLTQLVASAAQAPQTVGFSVAIARDGQLLYEAARGKRTLNPDAPTTPQTWYCIGSVTKQFTAALVMQEVERGAVRLDDALAKTLPSFPHAAAVTIRQLLSHTSGLPEYAGEAENTGLLKTPRVEPATLVALIAGKPLVFAPGSRWEYCNSNYLALGLLLEKVASKSYAALVEERLARPLDLQLSAAVPPAGAGDVAQGYAEGDPPKAMTNPDVSWAYAAGELYATTQALVRWNAALFGGKVVAASSLTAMTTPVVTADGRPSNYGFGLSVVDVNGRKMISHNGGVPGGFAAQNFVFPTDGLAIVTLANTLDFNVALPATRLAEVFFPELGASLRAFSQEQLAPFDDPRIRARAAEWIGRLARGDLDTAQFTPEMRAAMTPQALKGPSEFLRNAGEIRSLKLASYEPKGGYRVYVYRVTAASAQFSFTFVLDSGDRIAGLFLRP